MKKIIVCIFLIILLFGFGIYFYEDYVVGNSKYLNIKLNGKKEIILDYKGEYKDLGATASYKDKNITKDIVVKSDVNFDRIGSYTYTYTIAHKKQKKEITRKINIVDRELPTISLNGNNSLSIYEGDNYKEQGASATDNYDGNITSNIKIKGNVDTGKVGKYVITYEVSDSSNNTSSVSREVNIVEKPKPVQKIAVLNYHFFYETDTENETLCGKQSICLKMDRFRKQLKWLNDNGYKTLTIKEFVDWMYGRIQLPDKSVLITVDDGAFGTGKNSKNYLIPALEEYKIHATLFLVTGWWDISNYKSSYLDVESHTHLLHESGNCSYGSKVNCIGYDNLVEDLNKSIAVTNSKEAFCFPFYEYSNESVRAVRDVGFKVAFIGGNRKASRNDNKYLIPRYPIYDSTTMQQFINMVS